MLTVAEQFHCYAHNDDDAPCDDVNNGAALVDDVPTDDDDDDVIAASTGFQCMSFLSSLLCLHFHLDFFICMFFIIVVASADADAAALVLVCVSLEHFLAFAAPLPLAFPKYNKKKHTEKLGKKGPEE